MTRRIWSDGERRWGPFVYHHAPKKWAPTWEIVWSSGYDEHPGNQLRIRGFRRTFIVLLPSILRPYRERHAAHSWDAATVARLGRNYYFEEHNRCYGFYCTEGHFNIHYGRQTDDSRTEQRWSMFLPWTQWRHVRESWYGRQGEHIDTVFDGPATLGTGPARYERARQITERTPKVRFAFRDFDGELITATTYIEEREWRFGTGWCRWLSWFRRPKIRRSLDIQFSAEVGPRKGSWKGGTLGHIDHVVPMSHALRQNMDFARQKLGGQDG